MHCRAKGIAIAAALLIGVVSGCVNAGKKARAGDRMSEERRLMMTATIGNVIETETELFVLTEGSSGKKEARLATRKAIADAKESIKKYCGVKRVPLMTIVMTWKVESFWGKDRNGTKILVFSKTAKPKQCRKSAESKESR